MNPVSDHLCHIGSKIRVITMVETITNSIAMNGSAPHKKSSGASYR